MGYANPNDPRRKDSLKRASKNYSLHHPDKWLRVKYGMTGADWANMFLHQDGKCAICGKWLDLGAKRVISNSITVDHKHGGSVRALLCRDCNVGLGHFHEDTNTLRSAANYLEKYGEH